MAIRKIDCVMIKVAEPQRVAEFYTRVFGLHPLWSDEVAVGLQFPDSDAEVVVHSIASIPVAIDINYLVEDVSMELEKYCREGCKVKTAPFDIPIGKCAVFEDPFGVTFSILDMTKGPRKNTL